MRSNIRRWISLSVRSSSRWSSARTVHNSHTKCGRSAQCGRLNPLQFSNRVWNGGPAVIQVPWYATPQARAHIFSSSSSGKPVVRKEQICRAGFFREKPCLQPTQVVSLFRMPPGMYGGRGRSLQAIIRQSSYIRRNI
jgi:hypothetical protein